MGSSSKKEKKEKKEKREKKKSKKRKDKKEKHSKKRTRDDSSSSDSSSSPEVHVPEPPSVKRPRTAPPSPPKPITTTGDETSDVSFCGPERPPDLPREVGPQRPPRDDEEGGVVGPQRPKHNGPSLPEREDHSEEDTQRRRVGPSMPEGMNLEELIAQATAQGMGEEEEEDVVGPTLPTGDSADDDGLRAKLLEIERRSLAMKQKMEAKASGTEKLSREEWMVELPPEHVLGMGAALQSRTFNNKPQGGAKGDRSQWTDTPAIIAERQAKAREKAMGLGGDAGPRPKVATVARVSERDQALAAAVDAYNEQRRGQSLMNIHKEKDEGETKWRPFSRDTDLNVYRMDGNKRGKMVDEAGKLDSKFSKGERRFL